MVVSTARTNRKRPQANQRAEAMLADMQATQRLAKEWREFYVYPSPEAEERELEDSLAAVFERLHSAPRK